MFLGPALVTAVVAVAAYQWWFDPVQVTKRKLRGLPATPIAQLRPDEVVKVSGLVQVREPVTAPFSETPCAWWHAKVEEKVGKHWRTRAERWRGGGFWVVDGADRVWVDPGDRRLTLTTERAGVTGLFQSPDEHQAEVLTRFGVDPVGLLGFNRHLRFWEARLDEGEEVSVLGRVQVQEVDGEPVLSLVAAQNGLLVSDLPGVHR